ncbi:alpha/beta fold hydrolase [Phytohabitans aurantiacus]|jgi:pimeloyl-ACP methyl ester carboxylesterase|uniref:Alpha/beta hydrolase n=1 Tax=Phytohabitans aurantiacus TaxID=3016789 RepID=A0ABQ5QQR9_9ACTN|nr:alpha/beta hydrolase [Phytohabitans aurantiacus]GLH95961.1 alpha/beta hydrolase [Phytohabitans aurantiacus]
MRLHYRDSGAGRPLLLVHGWGGDSRVWDPIPLPGCRTVAVDLRGHGRSPVPDEGYRPADLAADLAELATDLGLGPVVAIGHSMGAQVVTALAVEHPGTVEALVVVDPAYGADAAEERLFDERLSAVREGGPAAVTHLGELPPDIRRQFLATPGHVLADCYAGMYTDPGAFGARPAAERYLRRRTCPVLCLRSLAEPAAWEAAIGGHPLSRMVVWAGTGHFLHLERPAAFATLVTSWLSTLGRVRG